LFCTTINESLYDGRQVGGGFYFHHKLINGTKVEPSPENISILN